MQIEIDVNLHTISPNVEAKIDKILQQQGVMMAKVDDLKAELVAANQATDDIAVELDDLVKKLAAGGLTADETAEVTAQATALKAKLQGIASTHTPGSPV
jgi:hypothetical protein